MSSLDIRINTNKIKNYSASIGLKLDTKTLLKIMKSFSEYVMQIYLSMIEDAINSNRYKGQWEPIDDEGYKEYIGTEPTGEILSYMRKNFSVSKIGHDFIIRLNPKEKYPGSKLSIERVVLAIDNGTSKFHSRPIFRSISRKIRLHILDLYKRFLSMKGVI